MSKSAKIDSSIIFEISTTKSKILNGLSIILSIQVINSENVLKRIFHNET